MLTLRFYMLQRLSALILAPLVLGHIAVMIYAVQDGLTAAEILGRTRDSLFWGLFYGLFVVTVSVHAAIGVTVIASEWLGLRRGQHALMGIVCLGLLIMGLTAVWSVTTGGAP